MTSRQIAAAMIRNWRRYRRAWKGPDPWNHRRYDWEAWDAEDARLWAECRSERMRGMVVRLLPYRAVIKRPERTGS